ncbi:hypothetical protein DRJ25_02235 [Candidatus Woesearchaeota archaeon]|nr:MAG: hypothetical protein DRJ25_02235 [Candidatus Woesearchaeota archaeon]
MTKNGKKRILTHSEEFEIMKLVLDKFLWLGTLLLLIGIYLSVSKGFSRGFWFILTGALVMLLFAFIIIKEFERLR